MPPAVDRVYTLAREVLDAVIAGYAAAGVDLPARRLVTPGTPSWDCEMVAVQAERGFRIEGDLSAEAFQPQLARAGHSMGAETVGVTVLRCVPPMDSRGNPPLAADEEAATKVILTDVQRLQNILVAAQRSGGLGGCSGLMFEQWQNVGPQGGLAGVLLRVRLTVGV